ARRPRWPIAIRVNWSSLIPFCPRAMKIHSPDFTAKASRAPVRRGWPLSPHQNVAELPRVVHVEILGEETRAAVERSPVGVVAADGTQIGQLNLEAATVVDLIRFDDPGLGMFQRPYHPCDHR